MKPYPKYKPSGIEWIGEIPSHWDSLKIKKSLSSLESGSRETGGGNLLEGVFSLGGEHIGWFGELLLNNPKFIPEDYFTTLKNGKIKSGDVLLVKDGATIGKCAVVKKLPFLKCAVNEHVFILRANEHFIPAFIFYFIWCHIGREQILLNVRGSAQPGLNSNFINEVYISVPPKEEQTTIADYLDKKTAHVDESIAKKQKLIELLKEERTAIVNEAVSGKGKNWERKKLKYVAKLKSGDGITSDDIRPDGEFPVYGGNGLRGYTSVYTHEGNYVLIGRQGALCGNINYANGKFFASEHAVVVSILDGSEFLWLGELLRSMNLNQYSLASAQPGLSVERIQNLTIPVPAFKEQKKIVSYIQTETQKIDNTISKMEKEIELMQEYRTALISEVVTGKADVREYAKDKQSSSYETIQQ